MSHNDLPQPLHFEVPATFVGRHTTCLVVALDVLDGELRFEHPERAVLAAPTAAPFEVHVRGRLHRRAAGIYGLADPDGVLARTLGLEPVRASSQELRRWRRRCAMARTLFGLATLVHALFGLWLLPQVWRVQLAMFTPDVPLLLFGFWLFCAVSFPWFFASLLFWYPRSVGYLRRSGLILAFSMIFYLVAAMLADSVSGAVLLVPLGLAIVGWHLLRAIPMLGEIPSPTAARPFQG